MFLIDAIAISMPSSPFASLVFVIMLVAAVAAIWYNAAKNVIVAIIIAVVGIGLAGGVYLLNNLLFEGVIVRFLLWLSVFSRFNTLARGVLSFGDIVYYFAFAALFIYLTVNVIEKRRWR
jgi:ABC-2 type transport system permease protein